MDSCKKYIYNNLTGIASVPEKEQFIVADYENRWMSVFEAKGQFAFRFGMGKLLGKTIIYLYTDLEIFY